MSLPARLAGLHARCFPPRAAWDGHAMASLLATPGCIVSCDETGLVMIRVAADEAEILTLGVVPEHRRQGRGRTLLDDAARAASAAGARRLFIDVAARNRAAIALYEGYGFVEVGRRPRYYEDGDDARVMAIELALGAAECPG